MKIAFYIPFFTLLLTFSSCDNDSGNSSNNVNNNSNIAAGPIDDLQPGEWYEIPNSKLSEAGVYPDPMPPGSGAGVAPIMSAWSGGVYDTKRDRLLIWGGGHTDYSGNEVYAFDMNTLSWSRIWGPTPNAQIPLEGVHQKYPDGNPGSRHTYNYLVYIPEPFDVLWNHGGSLWKEGAPAPYPSTWLLDLKTGIWEDKGELPNNPGTLEVAYDSVTGKLFGRAKYGIYSYDPVNVVWEKKYHYGGGWWPSTTGAIDPVNRKMFFIGKCLLGVFDLETNSYTDYTEDDLAGYTDILCATAPGFVYDSLIGKFVAWTGDNTKQLLPQDVYVIDPETLSIEKRYPAETSSVIPTESDSRGTYGRFRYVPSKDVFVVVNCIYENVYVYKLSNLTGNPPGYGSTANMSELRINATIYSIGIEWDIDASYTNKDVNHDAQTSVRL